MTHTRTTLLDMPGDVLAAVCEHTATLGDQLRLASTCRVIYHANDASQPCWRRAWQKRYGCVGSLAPHLSAVINGPPPRSRMAHNVTNVAVTTSAAAAVLASRYDCADSAGAEARADAKFFAAAGLPPRWMHQAYARIYHVLIEREDLHLADLGSVSGNNDDDDNDDNNDDNDDDSGSSSNDDNDNNKDSHECDDPVCADANAHGAGDPVAGHTSLFDIELPRAPFIGSIVYWLAPTNSHTALPIYIARGRFVPLERATARVPRDHRLSAKRRRLDVTFGVCLSGPGTVRALVCGEPKRPKWTPSIQGIRVGANWASARGFWRGGLAHGTMHAVHVHGMSYQGETRAGFPCGRGTYRDSRGCVTYDGSWERGRYMGRGLLRMLGSDWMLGDYVDGFARGPAWYYHGKQLLHCSDNGYHESGVRTTYSRRVSYPTHHGQVKFSAHCGPQLSPAGPPGAMLLASYARPLSIAGLNGTRYDCAFVRMSRHHSDAHLAGRVMLPRMSWAWIRRGSGLQDNKTHFMPLIEGKADSTHPCAQWIAQAHHSDINPVWHRRLMLMMGLRPFEVTNAVDSNSDDDDDNSANESKSESASKIGSNDENDNCKASASGGDASSPIEEDRGTDATDDITLDHPAFASAGDEGLPRGTINPALTPGTRERVASAALIAAMQDDECAAGLDAGGACVRDSIAFGRSGFRGPSRLWLSWNLRGAVLRDVTVVACVIRDVDLRNAELSGCVFYLCRFTTGAFDGARFINSAFVDCDLRDEPEPHASDNDDEHDDFVQKKSGRQVPYRARWPGMSTRQAHTWLADRGAIFVDEPV